MIIVFALAYRFCSTPVSNQPGFGDFGNFDSFELVTVVNELVFVHIVYDITLLRQSSLSVNIFRPLLLRFSLICLRGRVLIQLFVHYRVASNHFNNFVPGGGERLVRGQFSLSIQVESDGRRLYDRFGRLVPRPDLVQRQHLEVEGLGRLVARVVGVERGGLGLDAREQRQLAALAGRRLRGRAGGRAFRVRLCKNTPLGSLGGQGR